MEPDPLPEPKVEQPIDTQITNTDIEKILGAPKKHRRRHLLYLFSKKVIIAVATISTFVFLSAYYFGVI